MRSLLVALALGGLASCLQPALVPCGDQSCPQTTVCVADRCVTAAQLASCDGHADGIACAVGDRVGICDQGVCTYVGCGNGVIDPGEACDDGNTAYGDGCSADCRSLETCGNGVVDYALGEGCDCGADSATQPAQCTLPNSDSGDAECSPSCQLRYCGDGELNVLEQCDGSELGGASCAAFGYYHGAPACSNACVVDVASCYGRCGDNDVEPAFGEYCDGGPPPGSCLTYGYDAGRVACSNACTPGVTDCERFGWVQIETQPVLAIHATTTGTIVVSSEFDGATNAWTIVNGIRVPAPAGTYAVATGDGARGFAIGATQAAQWSGNAWSAVPVGWTGATPIAAWATPTLGLFVAVGDTVWRYDAGVWTDQALAGVTGLGGSATEVFAWTATGVWTSTGTAWTAETPPNLAGATIDVFARGQTGPTWLGAGSKLYQRVGSTWTARNISGTVESAQANPGGVLVVSTTGAGAFRYYPDGSSESLLAPANPDLVRFTTDGSVAFGGASGGYLLRSGAWVERNAILAGWAYDPYQWDSFCQINASINDHVAMIGGEYVWSGRVNYSPDREAYDIYAAAPLGDGSILYLNDYGVDRDYSYLWSNEIDDGMGGTLFVSLTTMKPTPSGGVVAGGYDWIVRFSQDGTIEELELPGYIFDRVSENAAGTIGAIARFGGERVIVRVEQGVATVVGDAGAATSDVWISPTNEIVAVGGSGVLRCGATTCTSEVVGFTPFAVAGSSSDDLFVGGRLPGASFAALNHWDGARWTPVRTAASAVYGLSVSDRSLFYTSCSQNVYRLPRFAKW